MIALLSATWDEINTVERCLEESEKGSGEELQFKSGKIFGKKSVLAKTGVGIKRARKGTSYIIQKPVEEPPQKI